MKIGKHISRLVLVGLVAAAVAGPVSAQAQQAYDVNQVTGAYTPAVPASGTDLRSEFARAHARSHGSVEPHSIVPAGPKSGPLVVTDSGGGTFDWPAGLIVGGVVALAGAALLARQTARGHNPAH